MFAGPGFCLPDPAFACRKILVSCRPFQVQIIHVVAALC
ncbi:hypothetical protein SLEP1_g43354 [Rubroshorea leprosula]|uniref:Uncharacterized protein n=1 Tax=Rubroshorea leprosula TaxID=152421 RepID=A0AAV5LDP1_9ROSI|nr:hypothetical protein SLEP1_g43354 [Rubroshorea leprosula]